MARDLVLHIGMSKTGSTSIQKVLSRQRPAMLAQGFYYPESPGYELHGYLAFAATTDLRQLNPPDKPIWQGMSPVLRLRKFREEFAAEMAAIPANVKRIIVSDEKFSMMLLDRQSVQNLHDMLKPYADSFTVVLYLRRPDQHFVSLYTQLLRRGDARRPDQFDLEAIAKRDYDYAALVERWAEVFGAASLRLRLFERVPGQKFDVVEDFLAICELKLAALPEDRSRSANPSINLAGQIILQRLGEKLVAGKRVAVQSPVWQRLTAGASEAMPGRGWQMSRAQAEWFVACTADQNDVVRRKWFPERISLFADDFSELPEVEPSIDDGALLDASLRLNISLAAATVQLESRLAESAARSAGRAGDPGKMVKALSKRISKEPDNLAARVRLARMLLQGHDLAAARRHIDAVLQSNARHPAATELDKEIRRRSQI